MKNKIILILLFIVSIIKADWMDTTRVKVSELGVVDSSKQADLLMIVQDSSGTKKSRKIKFEDFRSGILFQVMDGLAKADIDTAQSNIYNQGTIFFPKGDYNLNGSSITIGANVNLKFEPGAVLRAGTLTVNGAIEAGVYQIFGAGLTVDLTGANIAQTYPEWWGAVGGGTNDYTALNACFAASLNKQVFLGQDYTTASKLQISCSNKNFEVVSFAGTKIISSYVAAGTYGTPSAAFEIVSANNVLIDNVIFKFTNSGLTYTDGLLVSGCDNVEINNSSFKYAGQGGLTLWNIDNATLNNCIADSNKYAGILYGGVTHLTVIGGTASYNGTTIVTNGYGIAGWSIGADNTDITIKGMKLIDNFRKAVDVHMGQKIVIDGCFVNGFGYGGVYAVNEYSSDVTDIIIKNCIIENSTAMFDTAGSIAKVHPIQAGGYGTATTTSGSLIIEGNIIRNIATDYLYAAIDIFPEFMDKISVKNNLITNADGVYGIALSNVSYPATPGHIPVMVDFSDNLFQGDNDSSLVYVGHGTLINVKNNKLYGNAKHGIELNLGTIATVSGNDLYGTYSDTSIQIYSGIKRQTFDNTLNGYLVRNDSSNYYVGMFHHILIDGILRSATTVMDIRAGNGSTGQNIHFGYGANYGGRYVNWYFGSTTAKLSFDSTNAKISWYGNTGLGWKSNKIMAFDDSLETEGLKINTAKLYSSSTNVLTSPDTLDIPLLKIGGDSLAVRHVDSLEYRLQALQDSIDAVTLGAVDIGDVAGLQDSLYNHFTEAESNTRFFNVTGDTVSGLSKFQYGETWFGKPNNADGILKLFTSTNAFHGTIGFGDPESIAGNIAFYLNSAGGTFEMTGHSQAISTITSLQDSLNVHIPKALTSAKILVGNVSNVATQVSVSGDGTLSNAGVLAVNDDSHNHVIGNVDLLQDSLNAHIPKALSSGKMIVGNVSNVATQVSVSGDGTLSNAGVLAVNDDSHNHVIGNVDLLQDSLNAHITRGLTSAKILVGNGSNLAAQVSISGDASLANTGALTITDDSHAHVISNVDNLQDSLNAHIPKALTSAKFLVGNGSNVAAQVSMSGDATLANTGAVTVVDDSHAHVISNVDNLQDSLNVMAHKAGTTFTGLVTFETPLTTFGVATNADGSIKMYNDVTAYTTTLMPPDNASNKTITFPDVTGTVALTVNKISDFASVTSAELFGKVSDETGSAGYLVRSLGATLVSPTLGVASGTALGLGTGTRMRTLDVFGNVRTTGKGKSALTGSIDPAASTTVDGVNTLFLSELVVGDQILVSGETRTVASITNDTRLIVTSAFSNNANDTSPDLVNALFIVRDSTASANTNRFVIDYDGDITHTGTSFTSSGLGDFNSLKIGATEVINSSRVIDNVTFADGYLTSAFSAKGGSGLFAVDDGGFVLQEIQMRQLTINGVSIYVLTNEAE